MFLTQFIFSMHITLTHLTTLLRWRTWTEADGISTLIITCPDQRSRQMTPMHAYSRVLDPWKRFNGINVVLLTLPSEVAHHRQQYRSAHTQIPCMDNMCATIDHCFTPFFFWTQCGKGEPFIYLIIVVIVFYWNYLVVLFLFLFLILRAGEAFSARNATSSCLPVYALHGIYVCRSPVRFYVCPLL